MRSMLMITVIALLVAGTTFAQERVVTPPAVSEGVTVTAPVATMGENSAAITLDDPVAATAGSELRRAMMEELRLVREQESRRVADLMTEFENAVAADERLDIQNRIGDAKADAIQQSLTIQLEYAQLGGHEELAQRLETDIELFAARRAAPRGTISTDTVRERPVPGGESR